jgi:hypothetical protein
VALAHPIHLDRMTCRALPAGPEHAHCRSLARFGAKRLGLVVELQSHVDQAAQRGLEPGEPGGATGQRGRCLVGTRGLVCSRLTSSAISAPLGASWNTPLAEQPSLLRWSARHSPLRTAVPAALSFPLQFRCSQMFRRFPAALPGLGEIETETCCKCRKSSKLDLREPAQP